MISEKRLSVQLLGQPLITWGGQAITIPRKQARLIIYFLACQKSMVSRSDLILTFWPESANARQQLRDHLSKLRTHLPDANLLLTDRDWLGLNYERVQSDVLVFEEVFDQLSLPFISIEKRPLPEAIYQRILAAVNMWKAPKFMHGIGVLDNEDVNEWIEEKNRKLRFKWLSMMLRIAQHQMIVGDLEGALSWLEKVGEYDEDYQFPQVIFLRLDVLYNLRQLARAYELGKEYYDQTRTDWFAEYRLPFDTLMKKIDRERTQAIVDTKPALRSANGMNIPLVGREDTLTEMQRAYRRNNVIVLSAETGMGKTRLMHDFVNRLAVPLMILSMEAVYTERDIPFHPLVEMLRRSMNMSDWQKVENFWLVQLTPLFPELQNMVEKHDEVIGVIENQRLSLYESFRQVLLSLIGKNKILITFENAQWADEETIRLLAYLVQRRFFIEHANLILLSNPDQARSFGMDISQSPDWGDKLELAWIQMPPLTVDDIANIGLYLSRTRLTDKQSQQLLDATGGNPLFVIETLQMILEKPDDLTRESLQPIPLPGVVHIVIRERLEHISPSAKQVIRCAAVVGEAFLFDYILMMLDLSELELVAAIDELITKNFISIISQVQQPLRYKFNQTLLRDVVLRDVSQTEKQVFHRRLVQHLLMHLEQDINADQLADVAYHCAQAGKIQEAFSYWINAANQYSDANDLINAHNAFENALQISQDRKFNITDKQLYDLWIGWGELAIVDNNYEKATEYYHRAVQEGLFRNSSLLIGSGLSGEGFLYLTRGLPHQAKQYLDRATTYLKEGSIVEYIRVGIRKMLMHLYNFHLIESEAEFDSINWLKNQLKTPKELIAFSNAQNTLVLTKVLMGKFDEVEGLIEESNKVSIQYGNWTLRMRNEFAMGLGYYYQGRYQKALEHMGTALNIAETNYIWRFVLETLSVTSHIHLATGKTYLCYECIYNAYNLAKVYQYTGLHHVLVNAEGKLHLAFGNYQKAIQLFEEAIKFSNHERSVMINQILIHWSQAMAGELQTGESALEKIREEANKKQWVQVWLEATSRLGLIRYLKGEVEEALLLLAENKTQAEKLGYAGAGTAYAYVQAKDALKKGDHARAKEQGSIILQKAKQENSLWLEWYALEILISATKTEGESCQILKSQLRNVIREINQSKPQGMDLEVNPSNPSLFALV